jgi:hypothetical protein
LYASSQAQITQNIVAQKGHFIIRQHQSLPWQATDDFCLVAQSDRAIVSRAKHHPGSADDGQRLLARRIKVSLEEPLRNGEKEIFILTNLPSDSVAGARTRATVASELLIAQIYRKRCQLETLFQVLTENLEVRD